MSTCGECAHFDNVHIYSAVGGWSGRCRISYGGVERAWRSCERFSTLRYPLPRIGSEKWPWENGNRLKVRELDCEYVILDSESAGIWAFVNDDSHSTRKTVAEHILDLRLAQRLCELHARREWRRKQRAARKAGASPEDASRQEAGAPPAKGVGC